MENASAPASRWLPFILFIAAFGIYSINSGGLMLYALDEAKNAGCAREMYRTGEWVVPTFNGQLRTDKPPLHYYHMMLAYRVFGISEFSARFFSAIYGALTVLLVFLFARQYWGQKAALGSAAAMLASVHLAFQFHFAVPDPYLIFFLTLAVLCFFRAYETKKGIYLLGLYGGVAMGTLAKGPVAIGLPGLIFLIFLLVQRDLKWSALKPLRPFLGALFVAALVLPWYLLVWQATDGEWVREFFFKHNLNRYASTMELHRGYGVLPILFPLIGMLPLGIFLPHAVGKAWKDRTPVLKLCLVGAGVIIGFFIFSQTYLPNYTVPAYPYLALLLGYFLAQATDTLPKRWYTALLVLLIIAILFPVGGFFALKADKTLSPIAPYAWGLLVLPVAAILAYLWRDRVKKSLLALTTGGILTIAYIYLGFYPQMDAWNPVVRTLPDMDTERPIVYYRVMNPAYIFYLDEPVPATHTLAELEAFLEENPDAYVISRIGWRRDFNKISGLTEWREVKDILEIPTTLILTYDEP
ncbi:MAG TPA: phospholipid carrier-dependent glycosyltransferase [Cytophagales bacterium]|nr:phospholipid carrier-dependent glycosyltransferase [Cytophagales bacterium]HAA21606.1 phospholipid carrier-dependent glycosyltransferase [Cytophagales bacterium]HAP62833.1 phospholipid carrier-dependent glycosyltransferase [Cytophagales bacterium]